MTMLIENSSHHLRGGEGKHRFAVGGWPIRHGQAGPVAGDRRPGDNQQERTAGDQHRETMKPGRRSWGVCFGIQSVFLVRGRNGVRR